MSWFGRDKKSSTGAEGTSEQKARKFLSDCEAAEKIVNEYGGVLEITCKMSFGRPQSLLPRPKPEIKQAIINYVFGLHVQKILDIKTFNILQVGYASLAFFLNDADAKAAVAARAAYAAAYTTVAQSDNNSIDIKRLTSPNVAAALERCGKSNEEFKALSEEFDAVTAKLGIQF